MKDSDTKRYGCKLSLAFEKFLLKHNFVAKEELESCNIQECYVTSQEQNILPFKDIIDDSCEFTVVMIKPDSKDESIAILNRILRDLHSIHFNIKFSLFDANFSSNDILKWYSEHTFKPFFTELFDYLNGQPVSFFVISGSGIIDSLRNIIGPTNPSDAKLIAPNSIRAVFGKDKTRNAIHASDSVEAALKEFAIIREIQSKIVNEMQ